MLRPSGAGGRLTSPRGITAARLPFFIMRFEARPLGCIDICDLKVIDAFWNHDLISLNFPKTDAELGASEKLGGRLGKLLGTLGRVLSSLERLLGSLEALLEPPGALLGASWGLLRHSGGLPGASWAPLGSWAVLEATQNKIKMKSFLNPQKRSQLILPGFFFAPLWTPKSIKIGAKTRENFK